MGGLGTLWHADGTAGAGNTFVERWCCATTHRHDDHSYSVSNFLSSSVRSIPTALTIFRLLSAPVLIVLAYMGRERYFLWLAIAALLSDVLDGALARRLGASSETGRLLDSWADLLIAMVSFVGATLLWPDTMREEAGYFAIVLTALVAPNAWGLLRYRRLLGYHTVSAKASGVF